VTGSSVSGSSFRPTIKASLGALVHEPVGAISTPGILQTIKNKNSFSKIQQDTCVDSKEGYNSLSIINEPSVDNPSFSLQS